MSKIVRKSENLNSLKKKTFYQKLKIVKYLYTQKNPIFLVLSIEKISLRPELSSPPGFRIQGGYPKRDIPSSSSSISSSRTVLLFSNIGFFKII